MKILVVSQFYTPDITAAAFRIRESVDLLRLQGNEVRVITSYPHKAEVQNDLVQSDQEGIYRVNLSPLVGGGIRRYLQHYFSFVFKSILKGISIYFDKWRPDVIWTTSPPLFTGITGLLLAKLWKCPLVFDIRDIWPESAVVAGQLSATGAAFRIGKILEKKLYNWSNHITCVSKPMAEYIAKYTSSPITVIYNGALQSTISETINIVPKKRILYAGNLGRVQGLDTIIKAFSEAVSESFLQGWTLEFIGSGVLKEELCAQAEKLNVKERVIFHLPVKKEIVLKELTESALLFINLKDDRVFSLTIPSKVFDYLAINRPILFGINGEGHEILSITGGNVSFFPNDLTTLIQALRYAEQFYEQLSENAKQNRKVVLESYSREESVEVLIDVFQQVKN